MIVANSSRLVRVDDSNSPPPPPQPLVCRLSKSSTVNFERVHAEIEAAAAVSLAPFKLASFEGQRLARRLHRPPDEIVYRRQKST